MIISRNNSPGLSGFIRDIKKYTSVQIIDAIKGNPRESRRELLVWLFERAGKYNPNNEHYRFWLQHSHPVEPCYERDG